jgi:PAS domain S-box-containing protein
MAAEQRNLIEVIRQQLQSLAQLPIVRRPDQAALCGRTFANLLKQNPLYTNFGVIDADGTHRCSVVPMAKRPNLSDRSYFRQAMATRAFAIGDYQIGRVTGKAAVNLAYPVLDAAGNPQAVVFIALGLGALADRLIETSALPENSTLTIVNDRGTILVRQPDPEMWVGQSLPDAPLIRTILNHGKEGSTLDTGTDGVERLYVFTHFSATPASRVYVSIGIPAAVVFAGANKLFINALLLLALVTAVVVAAIWTGSNALVLRPANALIQATRRLGQGDLSARTDVPHRADEFGQIARSFDDMAGILQTRQAEAARAEARFTNIVNLAADAIISVDQDQHILIFNHGAELIFGYTAVEMLGQPLGRLLPERFVEAHRQHLRQFATEPQTARHMNRRPEIFGRRKDGNEFFAEASISRTIEDGKLIFTVYLRDISARKQAEEDIRQLNASLERRVFERTAELAAANKELEAFSYSVSHDLRAPLRSIDGFSQAVIEDCADRLDDQARDHLNRVRAATQRMGHLIDDMLALSRVTRAEMRRDSVNLSALAAEVRAELQRNEPERTVDWRIEPGLVAEGDTRLLRVVLVNLLGNAWKYTAHQPQPRIEFGAQAGADGNTDFFVRDNGAGFDMAYAGKLFGAFQRLHLESEFPGTGVGLATVQRVIHRHGGQVRGEGVPGQGATFHFTLPA